MNQLTNKFNENVWYIIALIIWIFIVFYALSTHSNYNNSDVQPVDESEMRNGDIW